MRQLDVTALREFIAAAGLPRSDGAPALEPLLLDVREPWEVDLGTIRLPGAQTVTWPMNSIPERLGELDPVQPIVCICHHGMRSAQVVAFLERHGCASVYNLAGGTDAWSCRVDPQLPRY